MTKDVNGNEADMPSQRRRFVLRFSRQEDTQKLMEFYNENTHENVYVRDPDVLEERIRNGAAIIFEDEHGNIQGASVAYPIENAKGEHEWTELGSTRITFNGFGLYPYMVAAQTIQGFMVEPPEDSFVAEVDIDNDAVISLLHGKLQWPDFDAPEELTDKMEDSVKDGEEIMPVNWYHCGPESIAHQAQVVKKLVDNPVLYNKRTEETVDVDLSQFPPAKHFRQALERLARYQVPEQRQEKHRKIGRMRKFIAP